MKETCTRWVRWPEGLARHSLILQILLLLIIAPAAAWAQLKIHKDVSSKSPGTYVMATNDKGELVDSVYVPYDSTKKEGKMRVIVQLHRPSVAEYRRANPKASAADLRAQALAVANEQQDFLKRLSGLEDALVANRTVPYKSIDVTQHYESVLNGLAITCWRQLTPDIRKIVKKMEEDWAVEMLDAASFPVIGLPCFQSANPGVDGTGLDIGIIDTGIDYMHAEFGSAWGPGFQISDWFDFAGTYTAPVDFNGHGTHVAGIAAAQGASVVGVAPGVNITAYRVFDNFGYGAISWTIAALNRSTDPNMDLIYTDRLDVVNLSLGAPGDVTSLMSIAADNASFMDVVVVAAMGNSGPSNYTAMTPGVALEVIGVGASDNFGNIASFSSRGPGSGMYNLKPDVVAPGVNINSAWTGGGYNSISGTSMASPHVAGAAILLRQLYPTRTPAEIKAMLMQSATPLGGYNVWDQGSGLIDLCNAPAQACAVTPGSVSLGMVDCSLPLWTQNQTLTVWNYEATSVTYNLSIPTVPPVGATYALSTGSVTVAPGGSASFTLTVTVDPSLTPDGSLPVPTYQGVVNVVGGTCNEDVTFSYAKYNGAFNLQVLDPAIGIIIHSGGVPYMTMWFPPVNNTLLLPPGTYDIITLWWDVTSKCAYESIPVGSCAGSYTIQYADAIHNFPITNLDNTAAPLPFNNIGMSSITYNPNGLGFITAIGFSLNATPNAFNVNGYSANYRVDGKTYYQGPSTSYEYHDFPYQIMGPVSSGAPLINNPADFSPMPTTFHAWPGVTDYYVLEFPMLKTNWMMMSFMMWGGSPIPAHIVNSPWNYQTAWYGANPPAPFLFGYNNRNVWDISAGWPISGSNLEYEFAHTSGAETTLPELNLTRDWDFEPTWHRVGGNNIFCGYYAPRWSGRSHNTVSGSNTTFSIDKLPQFGLFDDQTGDIRIDPINWNVYDAANILLGSGTITNTTGGAFYTGIGTYSSAFPPYRVELKYTDYEIQGVPGVALAELFVDPSTSSNPNPAWLRKMYLRSNDFPTDIFTDVDHNELVLKVEDDIPYVGIAGVAAYYSPTGMGAWTALSLLYDSGIDIYHADFPCTIPTGYYDVMIIVKTNTGQGLRYTMTPAFYFNQTGSTAGAFDYTWVASAGSNLGYSIANTTTHDPMGNVITGVEYNGTLPFMLNTFVAPVNSAVVAKYDPAGNELWQVTTTGGNGTSIQGCVTDLNGNIYVTGYFQGVMTFGAFVQGAVGGADVFVAKLDPAGNILWVRTIGSAGWDYGYDIAVSQMGDPVFTGTVSGPFTFGGPQFATPNGDLFTASIDAAGAVPLWIHTNVEPATSDAGRYIDIAPMGDVYVEGQTFGGNFNFPGALTMFNPTAQDVFVAQYNAGGAPLTAYHIDSPNQLAPGGIDAEGGNLLVGGDFDGFVMVNGTPLFSSGPNSCFLVNANLAMAPNWTSVVDNNPFWLQMRGVGMNNTGESYAAMTYGTQLTIGALPTITTLPGTFQSSVAKWDALGTPMNLIGSVATPPYDYIMEFDLHVYTGNIVSTCGLERGPAGGGSIFGPAMSTSIGGVSLWTAATDGGCPTFPWTGVRLANPETTAAAPAVAPAFTDADRLGAGMMGLVLYPNPADGLVNLSISLPSAAVGTIVVSDLAGHQVAVIAEGDLEAGEHSYQLDRDAIGLSDGVYFVRCQTNIGTLVKKLVLNR